MNAITRNIIIVVMLAASACAGAQDKPVVLKGLDPVQLVAGKETKGQAAIAFDYGKFKYLFASSEDEKAFEAAPGQYAVQNDGKCLMMPDMPGNPDMYLVYKGKIYLAGSDSCYAAIKAGPQDYVDPQAQQKPKTVAILIFPRVEIIDYSGPWEVFGGAGYHVVTVAASKDPIQTVYGETVTPDYTFTDCPKPDIVLLPGGGVPTLPPSDPTMQWITKSVKEAPYTLSVCNGAFWLARAGLLDGKSATTTAGNLDRLASQFPKIHVEPGERVVDNGTIVTSGGLSAGIDGALHMVEKIDGADTAKSIAIGIEYNWEANSNYAPGNFANKYFRRAGNIKLPDDVKATTEASLGDATQWEERYTVTTTKSTPAEIFSAIDAAASNAHWTKVSSDDTHVVYKFKGDEGADWQVVYSLIPDPTVKGKYSSRTILKKV